MTQLEVKNTNNILTISFNLKNHNVLFNMMCENRCNVLPWIASRKRRMIYEDWDDDKQIQTSPPLQRLVLNRRLELLSLIDLH